MPSNPLKLSQSSQPAKKPKPNSFSSRKLKTVKLSSSQPIESKKLKLLSSVCLHYEVHLAIQIEL